MKNHDNLIRHPIFCNCNRLDAEHRGLRMEQEVRHLRSRFTKHWLFAIMVPMAIQTARLCTKKEKFAQNVRLKQLVRNHSVFERPHTHRQILADLFQRKFIKYLKLKKYHPVVLCYDI